MRLRTLVSLSALLLSWQRADGQLAPADDFFHGGAQSYLSNNIPAALERVEAGLRIYPDDIKLKKLEELLKQQQQQQQNQNQQEQSKQDQQQQKSDEQKQQEQSQAEQKQKEEQERQQAKSNPQDEKKSDEQQQTEPQPVQAGQMTEQQAKQLLDAQKGREQVLIFKPTGEKEKVRKKTLKDW